MQISFGESWLKLSMVETLRLATVSFEEIVPPKAVSENTLKMVHTIVSSRPMVVDGTKSPNPKVLMLTNA